VAVDEVHPGVEQLAESLRATLGPAAVRRGEPLARYTALRIGGPADLLVKVESLEMLRQAVTGAWERDVPCCVLGGGSNVLIADAGVRGLVIINRARKMTFAGQHVTAESGASLSTLARRCVTRGLAGLEWAAGIPGTVGGAVVGNAGAWGGDVASALTQATILEPGGSVTTWPVERFQYAYRTSILKQQAASSKQHGAHITHRASRIAHHAIVLDAEFVLQPAEQETLKSRVAAITARRKASQPPGATCGSMFKNPPGDYAGRLIEAAGLKGARHGGAEISAVHANFFINRGGATAADIQALIDLVRETVLAQFGVTLELEIELIGG
jgi:UDP-N-acetylmuramate dehydrogenase